MELTNKYFKNLMKDQNEIDYFQLYQMENIKIDKDTAFNKGSYSLLDSHDLINELKYDPADVWLWDPLKDKKAKAQKDANQWKKEKQFIINELKKSLKEEGVSSSAFIGFKNDSTKYLQNYRMNLPTQIYRKFYTKPITAGHPKYPPINYLTNNQQYEDYVPILQSLLRYEIIKIEDKAVDLIINWEKYFKNYSTFEIIFYSDFTENKGIYNIKNDKHDPYELLYGTMMNINNTVKLKFDNKIKKYVDDIQLLNDLDSDDYVYILSEYPILKILHILSKDYKEFNFINIIMCVYDTWYKQKVKHEKVGNRYIIKKAGKMIKYAFNEDIVIKVDDVLNYLGDSHYKNCLYSKGTREVDVSATTNVTQIITPGGKFEPYEKNIENNKFVKKIIISREITKTVPIYMNIMVIADDDLHKQYGITNNIARRCALVYNVDLYNVEPYFGTPNVLTTINKKMNYAINKEDIMKYLQKNGNPYTIMEMSDAEIEERKKLKLINEKYLYLRDIQFNTYKGALLKYYQSSNKKQTMKNLMENGYNGKKMDNDCLLRYKDAIDNAIDKQKIRKNKSDIEKYIPMLPIQPDFVDSMWPIREKFVNDTFKENFGITVQQFLSSRTREINMNIDKPKQFLDTNKKVNLPF